MIDGIDHMTLIDEDVLPPVVVEVLEPDPPSRDVSRQGTETGFQTPVREHAFPFIAKQAVYQRRQDGHHQIGTAVVVVILKNHAHAGHQLAISGKSRAGVETSLAERSIAVVVKQEVIHDIVGDENISETVAVVVGKRHTQSVTFERGNSGLDAHILKRAVTAIVIEDVADGGKLTRRAIALNVATAGLAALEVPVQIANDEQVELAVVIVVEKSRRLRPAASRHSSLRRHISERAVAVVVVEDVVPVAGYEYVGITVVVVVANGHPHSIIPVAGIGKAGLLGHVGKGAVGVLAIEPVPVFRVGSVEIS